MGRNAGGAVSGLAGAMPPNLDRAAARAFVVRGDSRERCPPSPSHIVLARARFAQGLRMTKLGEIGESAAVG